MAEDFVTGMATTAIGAFSEKLYVRHVIRDQHVWTHAARPFAGGINASQAGPSGGVNTNLLAGSATRTPVRPGAAAAPAAHPQLNLREMERFMPIASVTRIMHRALPLHAKISDDARETIQECVSEYIRFITGEANKRCRREQRKTITAEDVIWAMGKLGFDDYVAPLSLFLQRYRESEGDQCIGEHFPIVKHRRHPQMSDTICAPPVLSRPLVICLSTLPLPTPSGLIMPPTAPPPRINHLVDKGSGAGYFLGMHGDGDGAGPSNSEAPPMLDFFP
ncbi:nuclear transcription factor Y subunit B-6-like [Phoenix dactylifera]|uniref:Nuclear transcription factor Y subunit B-6-like n=1 Tax=Phoenix dactylifera TaxID=42345 RepID=A0A8B8ZZ81_PHODC|nr:nuclear transcription factor Y subunit B-6-like [Phoenix dactylifera]